LPSAAQARSRTRNYKLILQASVGEAHRRATEGIDPSPSTYVGQNISHKQILKHIRLVTVAVVVFVTRISPYSNRLRTGWPRLDSQQGDDLSYHPRTASVVYWSQFLTTDPDVPGSIPGAATFSE
jgi:hypothetical protein